MKPNSHVDRSLRDARQPIVHIDLPLRDARHLRNALNIASKSVSQAGDAERARYALLSDFIANRIRAELTDAEIGRAIREQIEKQPTKEENK